MREVSRSGDAGQPEENTEGATSFTEWEGGASAAVSELPTSQCMNSAMTCKGLSTKWPAAEPDRHGPPRCRGCSPGESARFLHLSLLKMCCDAVISARPCALSRQFLECPVLRDSKPLQVPKFRHGQGKAALTSSICPIVTYKSKTFLPSGMSERLAKHSYRIGSE